MKESLKTLSSFLLLVFTCIYLFFFQNIKNLAYKIISEGFMIGGWVALWEALAIVLVKWLPLNKNLKNLQIKL